MATVATTPRTNRFTLASASAGPFLVGFRLFASDGIDVLVDGVRQTSGFTVGANFLDGYDDNATVTFSAALPPGTVIQFDGALIPGRSADYANPDPTLTAKLNAELARLWSSVSEINQLVRRSVRALDPIDAVDGIDPEDIENLPANLAAASQAASDATSAAASATLALNQVLAIQDSLPSWRGPWLTATAYGIGDLVSQAGNSYICIVAHTSGTFSTDLSNLRWQIFAEKGAAGAGTGDMLGANNLSDVVNKPAALATLGGQPVDTDLTALAGVSATGLLARTGSGTAAARTITPGAGISVTNGDGVSGNPTIDFNRGAPVIKTADFTVAASENWLINNKSGSACIVTLPAASGATGREIMVQNLQAQAVNSASSNVVPMAGGAAAAAILPAVIGSRATLVSDGSNWRVVDYYVPPIGDGQTWQNVTGSRALATTYTNSTGRPIQISVLCVQTSNLAPGSVEVLVDGLTIGRSATGEINGVDYTNLPATLTAIVPNGSTYRVNQTNSTLSTWFELR